MDLNAMNEIVDRVIPIATKGKSKAELRVGDILKRKSNSEYCKLNNLYEDNNTICYYFKNRFGGFGVNSNCMTKFFECNYNEFNIYADMKGGHLA